MDFGTFTLPWGRRHALLVVLGHSRLLWLRFYPRQTMAVLIDGLESAFERFGGVPRELLFDQMRSLVLSDDRAGGGELILNAEFLRFAAHWGFMPRSCRPYRARRKGKVERPIRYLRENFFHGRTFVNDADLNEQATGWLDGTANARHERASTVLTSNKGFEEWGGVLGDEMMAAALIDRLPHHCHIVNIRGNSYRMREHRDLPRTAGPDQEAGRSRAT